MPHPAIDDPVPVLPPEHGVSGDITVINPSEKEGGASSGTASTTVSLSKQSRSLLSEPEPSADPEVVIFTRDESSAGVAARESAKPNSSNNNNKTKETKQRRLLPRPRTLFQPAVTVYIPMHGVTADLGIALHRTRTKRMKALVKAFPILQQVAVDASTPMLDGDNHDDAAAEEAMEEGGETSKKSKKPKISSSNEVATGTIVKKKLPKSLSNVPRPNQYASVMDYLEAKYVRGVVIDNAVEAQNEDDEDADQQGSVYSNASSFIDDTDLQRTVAEQVLAHTTTTKLELEPTNNHGDHEFFVNVGNLEVEETELTSANFDPLLDHRRAMEEEAAAVAAAKRKKRKKNPNINNTSVGTSSTTAKETKMADTTKSALSVSTKKFLKAASVTAEDATAVTNAVKKSDIPATKKIKTTLPIMEDPAAGKKKKEKIAESSSAVGTKTKDGATKNKAAGTTKDTAADVPSSIPPAKTPDQKLLEKKARMRKSKLESSFQLLTDMIQALTPAELPRRKNKMRVSVTCPADKNPGDEVTFANPVVPGQKLRAKIPASATPGSSFKVTIPVQSKAEENPDKDHNKFSKKFYAALEDYARLYDEWCDAQGDFCKAVGVPADAFASSHMQKRRKFDRLVGRFPTNLLTVVDKPYLQKILRRARQNKHKRELQLLSRQTVDGEEGDQEGSLKDNDGGSSGDDDDEGDGEPDPVEEPVSRLSPLHLKKKKALTNKKPGVTTTKSAPISISSMRDKVTAIGDTMTTKKRKVAADSADDGHRGKQCVYLPTLASLFATKRFEPKDFRVMMHNSSAQSMAA